MRLSRLSSNSTADRNLTHDSGTGDRTVLAPSTLTYKHLTIVILYCLPLPVALVGCYGQNPKTSQRPLSMRFLKCDLLAAALRYRIPKPREIFP
jgi:hypothetical protein